MSERKTCNDCKYAQHMHMRKDPNSCWVNCHVSPPSVHKGYHGREVNTYGDGAEIDWYSDTDYERPRVYKDDIACRFYTQFIDTKEEL